MNKIIIDNYEFEYDPRLTNIQLDEWGGGRCNIVIDKKNDRELNESLKDDNQIYIFAGDKIWKTFNPEIHLVWRLDEFIAIDIKGDLIKIDQKNLNLSTK
jgi:hypothetical protein